MVSIPQNNHANTPAEPLSLTEEDVAQLAGDRRDAGPIVKRMKAQSPALPTGRLESDKPGPPRITRAEMRAVKKSGKAPLKIRARFTPSDVSPDPAEVPYQRAPAPKRKPSKRDR